jgi:hypothetical protein
MIRDDQKSGCIHVALLSRTARTTELVNIGRTRIPVESSDPALGRVPDDETSALVKLLVQQDEPAEFCGCKLRSACNQSTAGNGFQISGKRAALWPLNEKSRRIAGSNLVDA